MARLKGRKCLTYSQVAQLRFQHFKILASSLAKREFKVLNFKIYFDECRAYLSVCVPHACR